MNKFSFSNKLSIIYACIAYMLMLDYIYGGIIVPNFEYYGFTNDFSWYRFLVSFFMLLPVPFCLDYFMKSESMSKMIVTCFLLGTFIPCLVLYTFIETDFIIWLMIYWLLIIGCAIKIKPIRIVFFQIDRNTKTIIVKSFTLLILAIVGFVWGYYAKFHLQTDILDVYETRYLARSFNMPTIINYFRSIGRAVIPLLSIYYLHNKNRIFFMICILIQMLNFSIDASKSVFFITFLGVILYYLLRNRKNIIVIIVSLFLLLSVFTIAEPILFNSNLLASVVLRRAFFLPALLNYQYLDYVNNNAVYLFKNSIGAVFNETHGYVIDLSRIIGEYYYGNPDTNANNGLFADAYANLGIIGVFIMPILVVIILKMLDAASNTIPFSVCIVGVIHAYFTFTGSSFFTVLLTHGIIAEIILMYLLKDDSHLLFSKGLNNANKKNSF